MKEDKSLPLLSCLPNLDGSLKDCHTDAERSKSGLLHESERHAGLNKGEDYDRHVQIK
jgi:hypothetical protein